MSFQSAIARTIHYARQFGVRLPPSETTDRLISPRYYQQSKLNTQETNIHPNPVYLQKLKIAQIFARQIKNIFPDILLLAITGSIAAQHPRPADDIDFLIITRPHTLWLTRLRLLLFLNRQHLSFRRFNQKESANLFCFNLWLDQSRLSLPPSKQNLRNAVDLVLLKPLIDKDHLYQQFLLANSWAKKYVCTPYTNLTRNIKLSSPAFSCSYFMNFMNFITFKLQYFYMLPKITTETITLHSAFFHPKSSL